MIVEERSDQSQQRLKKLDELRQLGIDPYGGRFDRADRAATILAQYTDTDGPTLDQTPISCTLAGRLTGLRRFGKAAFGVLRDERASLQVYFKKDALEPLTFQLMQQLDVGDWIGISGTLFRTKTNELTVAVSQLTLLSKSLQPLPEKWHGLSNVETRYRQRYLDLIANPEVHGIFVKRSRIIEAVRQFLITKDFLEVETPMMHQQGPRPRAATPSPPPRRRGGHRGRATGQRTGERDRGMTNLGERRLHRGFLLLVGAAALMGVPGCMWVFNEEFVEPEFDIRDRYVVVLPFRHGKY